MVNGIRTDYPRGFNKGRSSKFCVGSRVRQTPEEGRRTYRRKRCGINNKDEDNSPKTLNDKNLIIIYGVFAFKLFGYSPPRLLRKNDYLDLIQISLYDKNNINHFVSLLSSFVHIVHLLVGVLRGVVANVLVYKTIVSVFELLWRHWFNFELMYLRKARTILLSFVLKFCCSHRVYEP